MISSVAAKGSVMLRARGMRDRQHRANCPNELDGDQITAWAAGLGVHETMPGAAGLAK